MKSTNCEYDVQDNQAYGVMVLAYDILHDTFDSKDLECDIVYNICNDIMRKFFKSDEYNDFNLSFYDALTIFVENHCHYAEEY
jgi:hypothetical protein